MLRVFRNKQRAPQELADQAERILSGQCLEWDVEDFENTNPEDPRLKDLHIRALKFGSPEDWWKLDCAVQSALREVIEEIRRFASDRS
jgi:hypothetical protein